MASNAFPTPFNINRIQGIPGPTGPQGPPGSSNSGVDISKAPYGADKTGATDCTAAFAAASTASASDPSGQVYIPAGTYKLSSTQSISGNLFFAPGAILKPTVNEVITCSGQIFAGDYQQIFDTSLGGTVLLPSTNRVSACWFGANANSNFVVGTNTAAIKKARDAIYTGTSSGDGPVNASVFLPSGTYELEKPIPIKGNAVTLYGESRNSTFIQARGGYCGPAIVLSDQPTLTQHLNDYDTTLASCSIGDGGSAAPILILNNYGEAWALNGLSGFCLDMIIKTPTVQTAASYILSSFGRDAVATSNKTCFYIEALALDEGYSNSNLGIAFQLTTGSGSVTATTATGVFPTDGTWHHFRFDYDGSHMRIFVDGVAATLVTSGTTIAQTGTLQQSLVEAVKLGLGIAGGFQGSQLLFGPPTGLRMACLSLAHASRGSANFTPPTGKYPEDGLTKFLMDFDVIDTDGGLMFAREYSSVFGMQDAWIPNVQEAPDTQIGNIVVRDLTVYSFNGPAIDSVATPNCIYKNLQIRAQCGILLHQDSYFSSIEECRIVASTPLGIGIKLGASSNFVSIRDVYVNGFVCNLFSEAIFSATGSNYWVIAQFATIYVESCFHCEMTGSNFISDEGSSYHETYGLICSGVGVAKFSGMLFGLQAHTDQVQVWINNSNRPITYSTFSRLLFDHCNFSGNPSGLNAIKLSTMEAGDSVVVDDCDTSVPFFTLDSDSLAHVMVRPLEFEQLPVTLADSNTTLTPDQWCYGKLIFSGTLTADRNIIVPTLDGYTREIENLTAHALLVKTNAGTGVYVAPGLSCGVSCDGTNVVLDWRQGTAYRLINSGTSSTAKAWDEVVGVNVGTAYNLTGPTGTVAGQTFVGKDLSGAASTNNITLTAPGGQTYDWAATIVIKTDNGRASLLFDGGTNWMS